jgi:hypothetical protein
MPSFAPNTSGSLYVIVFHTYTQVYVLVNKTDTRLLARVKRIWLTRSKNAYPFCKREETNAGPQTPDDRKRKSTGSHWLIQGHIM